MLKYLIVPNGKLIILGVPILKHIRVDRVDIELGKKANINISLLQ